MDVRGRDLASGLPVTLTVNSDDILDALYEPSERVLEAIFNVLEKTPPELSSDIADRGIYMTGGGCLVYGFDKLITERTGIPVMIAHDSVSCVAIGTGKALEDDNMLVKLAAQQRRVKY